MILHKRLLGSAAMIAMLVQPAAAAPWQRGYVVGTYGFAFHYGSRPSAAATDPGSDCPHGSSVHFSDEANMRKALEQQPWRSKQEIDNIIKPPGIEQARLPTYVRFYIWAAQCPIAAGARASRPTSIPLPRQIRASPR